MTGPPVRTEISGGTQSGIIGAAAITAAQIIINNHPPPVAEPLAGAGTIGPCPYPGLAYFGPNDADRFFGRDEAIGKLMEAVGRQSLTAVVGASGSGKSSVVLAGLAPRLHHSRGWLFSYFRIGNEADRDPVLALARALVPFYVTSGDQTEQLLNTRKLAEKLRSGELALRDVFAACRSQDRSRRILLIADQFEEAFTLVQDDANRIRFIDVLLSGFPDPVPGTAPDFGLVLTLRADFYGHALLHRPLADALQGHVENLGPMNRDELQLAIVRPADNAEVSFEPGLIETLLDEVENKPGSLPLLQFALREMWRRQDKQRITRKTYDDIGGVEGALAKRAEEIFAAMTAKGAVSQTVRAFQRLFTRLVMLGEGQEDTRRIVDRRELGDEVWSLAQRLAGEDNRLVVTNAPAFSRDTAEVVHEALIRHWPRLVSWIDQDRGFLSWLRQIKLNVELWSVDPSDDGLLLRGGMLAQALDWLARRYDDLSPLEQGYIEASLALQQRAEEEREAAQREKQEALAREEARLAEIAGNVGHHFNDLLTEMVGFCELLLRRFQPGDPSFADITQIQQNANLAANLVRQLLAFSRQQTLQPRVLNITDVLVDLSHLLRRLIGENIELKVVYGRDLGVVKVDQGQLEQVIINLAVNARDAMPDGGMLTIRSTNVRWAQAERPGHEVMPEGDYVLIEVVDTGIGIPNNNLARIFEPFFSTKEFGFGTGLGLSTVYGIVKQTGGFVFVDSHPGQGALFEIYLPRYQATDASMSARLDVL
jgi:signal transduction histidine kinase